MNVLSSLSIAALACAMAWYAPSAEAHITLETQQAPVGAAYKAVFRVPHGCKGSATVRVRVRIPDGMIGVKPQPKPGWTTTTTVGDYRKARQLYGSTVTSGVQEVDWAGGPLPDDRYDEFVLVGYLGADLKPQTMLYFPVVQECEKGVERWIDIPAAGRQGGATGHEGTPAPGVLLLPARP